MFRPCLSKRDRSAGHLRHAHRLRRPYGRGRGRDQALGDQDSDGSEHSYLTPSGARVLTPAAVAQRSRLAYVSYEAQAANRLIDLASGDERPLLPAGDAMSFAALLARRQRARISMTVAGIPTSMSQHGGRSAAPTDELARNRHLAELLARWAADTVRSDRSGSQQLYVMDATGAGQRRLSFGRAASASPEWSPDGQRSLSRAGRGRPEHRHDGCGRSDERISPPDARRGTAMGGEQTRIDLPAQRAWRGSTLYRMRLPAETRDR